MNVHPSGYYAWKAEPASLRQQDDQRLLGLIKQSWLESGGVYGYRKIAVELGQRDQTLRSFVGKDVLAEESLELLSEYSIDVDAKLRALGII
jgi:putative transposase